MAVLELAADAPWIARAAAASALVLHIGGGGLGLVSGAVAVTVRKGERLHRAAGTVFFVSMLTMSGIAGPVSVMMGDRVNIVAAVLTFYLVLTSWVTVRRKEGQAGLFEIGALLAVIGVTVAGVAFIFEAAASPTGMIDGQPPQANYIFAFVGGIAAICDLSVILRGGVSGPQRIARHLWRMCFALFIAAGSLFLGQPQVFPEAIRQSPVLFAPPLATLILLVFWMLRVRLAKAFRPAVESPA